MAIKQSLFYSVTLFLRGKLVPLFVSLFAVSSACRNSIFIQNLFCGAVVAALVNEQRM